MLLVLLLLVVLQGPTVTEYAGISSDSIDVTDLQILKSSMREKKKRTFTRLPFENIAEVDISQSDIIVRRQFSVDITTILHLSLFLQQMKLSFL